MIVTGAGRAFSAGGDIDEMQGHDALDYYRRLAEPVHRLFNRLEALELPTIAAVNGPALGGGAELLLTLDLRLLAEGVCFGLPEIKMGLFPGAGGTQRLIRQMPVCRARELLFTGDSLSAEDAVAIGLANRVVPHGQLLEEARALALRMVAQSPLALRLLKRTIADGTEMPLAAALRHEQAMIGLAMESNEARKGLASFLERRAAESGRGQNK